MTFKGTVIDGGKLVLENGARLRYSADDCAEALRPGDRVLIDTGRDPSIRKSEPWSPVRETKVIAAEAVKGFEALARAHGDEL